MTVCFSLPSRYSFGTRERRNPSSSTRGRRDSRTQTWRFDCSSSCSSCNSVNKASSADIHGPDGTAGLTYFSHLFTKKKSHIKKGEAHLKRSHHFQSFSSHSELRQSSVAKRKGEKKRNLNRIFALFLHRPAKTKTDTETCRSFNMKHHVHFGLNRFDRSSNSKVCIHFLCFLR